MQRTLAIMVNTDKHFEYLLQIVKTAHNKDVQTQVFFTGQGVLLTKKNEFEQLVGLADLTVCDVSFRSNGLSGDVPGVGFKDFVTQAVNAEMAANCDRYIVL